jgi:hypothetical protein
MVRLMAGRKSISDRSIRIIADPKHQAQTMCTRVESRTPDHPAGTIEPAIASSCIPLAQAFRREQRRIDC